MKNYDKWLRVFICSHIFGYCLSTLQTWWIAYDIKKEMRLTREKY
jgi:hypothetical protein